MRACLLWRNTTHHHPHSPSHSPSFTLTLALLRSPTCDPAQSCDSSSFTLLIHHSFSHSTARLPFLILSVITSLLFSISRFTIHRLSVRRVACVLAHPSLSLSRDFFFATGRSIDSTCFHPRSKSGLHWQELSRSLNSTLLSNHLRCRHLVQHPPAFQASQVPCYMWALLCAASA